MGNESTSSLKVSADCQTTVRELRISRVLFGLEKIFAIVPVSITLVLLVFLNVVKHGADYALSNVVTGVEHERGAAP